MSVSEPPSSRVEGTPRNRDWGNPVETHTNRCRIFMVPQAFLYLQAQPQKVAFIVDNNLLRSGEAGSSLISELRKLRLREVK